MPPRRPRSRVTSDVDTGGRGLSMIRQLAVDWGTDDAPDGGKVVWCEVAL